MKYSATRFIELDVLDLLGFGNKMRSSSPTIIGDSARMYSATMLDATFPGCLFRVCLTNTSYLSPPPARNDDNKTWKADGKDVDSLILLRLRDMFMINVFC